MINRINFFFIIKKLTVHPVSTKINKTLTKPKIPIPVLFKCSKQIFLIVRTSYHTPVLICHLFRLLLTPLQHVLQLTILSYICESYVVLLQIYSKIRPFPPFWLFLYQNSRSNWLSFIDRRKKYTPSPSRCF